MFITPKKWAFDVSGSLTELRDSTGVSLTPKDLTLISRRWGQLGDLFVTKSKRSVSLSRSPLSLMLVWGGMTFLLLVFWPMAAWGWFARIPQAPLPATLAMLLAPFLGGAMSYAVVAMANRDTDFPILEFDRQTRQLKHLGKVVGRLDDIKCILFLNAPCHLKARHPHEDIDLHFEIKLLFRESLQRESILIHREEFENPEKHVAVRDFAKQAGVTCLHAAARKSNFNFVITVLN